METSKEEKIEILSKGLRNREENDIGESVWKGYTTDNDELKKIKFKLNHMKDGWGTVSFKNGSKQILEVDVEIEGQNIGFCKIFINFFSQSCA